LNELDELEAEMVKDELEGLQTGMAHLKIETEEKIVSKTKVS